MNFRNARYSSRCSFRVCFLAFLWIGCLLGGMYIASSDSNLLSLMRIAPKCNVSIVGLAAVLILPVMISIIGLIYQKSAVIYILSAIKAFASGYLLYGVIICYGYAGWLIRTLLLFSDSAMTIFLLWILFRHIDGRKATLWVDATVCIFAATAIGMIDYLLVAPFLLSLAG